MSDFNLPPGVRVSDIPGNRPSDVEPPQCARCEEPLISDEEIRMRLCKFHIEAQEEDYTSEAGKN